MNLPIFFCLRDFGAFYRQRKCLANWPNAAEERDIRVYSDIYVPFRCTVYNFVLDGKY